MSDFPHEGNIHQHLCSVNDAPIHTKRLAWQTKPNFLTGHYSACTGRIKWIFAECCYHTASIVQPRKTQDCSMLHYLPVLSDHLLKTTCCNHLRQIIMLACCSPGYRTDWRQVCREWQHSPLWCSRSAREGSNWLTQYNKKQSVIGN